MSLDIGWPDVWRFAIAIGLLMLLGRGVLTLFVRDLALGSIERLALSFLIGAGGVSLLSFWLSPFFTVISARWLVSLVTCGLVLCAWWRRRGAAARPDSVTRPRDAAPAWVRTMLWTGIALQCAALIVVAAHTPLGWDGLINFEMKARMAFLNEPSGRVPFEYLSDPSRTWSHPGYPLLVPLTEFWIYSWIGAAHQGLVKLLFPAFYLSLVGLFYGISSRLMPRSLALLGCVALGLLPSLAIGPGAAMTGYADVPLAAAAFGAVSFAYLALRTGARDYFVLAALLSALAVWTKREGTLIAAYVLVAVVLARTVQAHRDGRRPMQALAGTWWLLAVPAIVAGPWLWLQRRYGMTDHDFSPVTLGILSANLSRLPAIVRLVARELLLPGHWALLWPAFGMTLLLAGRRLRDGAEQFLLGAVVVPMALYTSVFLFSSWTVFAEHVGTALPRLIIPLAPIALFVTIRHLRACLAAA